MNDEQWGDYLEQDEPIYDIFGNPIDKETQEELLQD